MSGAPTEITLPTKKRLLDEWTKQLMNDSSHTQSTKARRQHTPEYVCDYRRRAIELTKRLVEHEYADDTIVKRCYQIMSEPLRNYVRTGIAVIQAMLTRDIYLEEHPEKYREAYEAGSDELLQLTLII